MSLPCVGACRPHALTRGKDPGLYSSTYLALIPLQYVSRKTVLATILMTTWFQLGGFAFPPTLGTPSFQPGSGALVPATTVLPQLDYSPAAQPRKLQQLRGGITTPLTGRGHPEGEGVVMPPRNCASHWKGSP